MKILIVDDDSALCRSLQIHLERNGHLVRSCQTARSGIAMFSEGGFDLTFVDLKLPDASGLEVLQAIRASAPSGLTVMITGTQDMSATIEAVRLGAFDCIRKPLDLDTVLVTIEKAAQTQNRVTSKRRVPMQPEFQPREIVGASRPIIEVIKQIGVLSQNRIPVLIRGESGTGKELVARALHDAASPGKPFVAINCSSVVSTLLESELFGHVRGSFTGADHDKVGRLELAGEGTVFFDEIGDMAVDLQAKLLRAIQERSFEPVGGVKSIPLRARVVAATHRNVESMVESGAFRKDLYYRLGVSTICVPPLRERRDDIPLLASHLLARIGQDLHRTISHIDNDAMRRLMFYDWPGNVRELENVLTRSVLLARTNTLLEDNVAASLGGRLVQAAASDTPVKTLRDAERDHVELALRSTGWNLTQAAALLDISPTTLRKKIHDYELNSPRDKL